MNKYLVNFERLVQMLTPSFLLDDRLVAWFKTLLKPLVTANDTLFAFVKATRTTLSYNSQKIVFETYLNDVFDASLRRIYINNTFTFTERFFIFFFAELQTDEYIYFASEGKPSRFIKFQTEFAGNFDFIVFVPVALTFDQSKMEQIIKNTKLAGKRFKIETF